MKRTTAIAVAAAFAAGGLVGALAYAVGGLPDKGSPAAVATSRPVWSEMQWPFPMDQWGRGKAYRCKAADCGIEVNLYVRAKIGFCKCDTGVSDDAELERVGDLELIGSKTSAHAPGREIAVAWMKGRSRVYTGLDYFPAGSSALVIAYNDRCDALVATAVIATGEPTALEPAVIAFLNGPTVMRWAERTLGL
jgi:hypothetical protein